MGDELVNIEDLSFKFAKYRITRFDLVIPGYDEPYSVDTSFIGNWSIEKDYENYVYPYIEVRCVVPDNIYRDVMSNSENVYVDLKVEYGLYEDLYEMRPEEALYSYGTILESRFYAFIDNKSPKLTDSTTGEESKDKISEDGLTQYSYDNGKALVMALYRADHILASNQIINAILSRCTVTDGVAYFFKQLGMKNVLMSPSDNPTIYDQLVLPPLPASKGLLRLANTYGLYKAGSIVFFDYDMIYVLNKKLGSTAWINNEIKTVYFTSFPSSADRNIMRSGFYANGTERYCAINIVGNSISVTNESMFADQVEGGNIIAINSNTGTVTKLNSSLNVSEMSPSKQGKFNRVVVQNTGNDGTIEAAKAAIEQSQNVLSFVMENVNIRALSPNKDFIFTTDNEKYAKYAGHYRITNASTVFTRESTMYTAMTTARFVGGQATI